MARYVLALSVVALFVPSLVTADAPWFCHDLDCPAYTVLKEMEGYEVRLYNSSKWVGTVTVADSWSNGTSKGFPLLFDYISGQNEAQEKVPMTVPVTVKVLPGQQPSNYTVQFFVPYAYQDNTPKPSNPAVFLSELPTLTAYVFQYGGFQTNSNIAEYAALLENYLKRDNVEYVPGVYFTGSYDTPYRIVDRHNEVWLLAP